MKTLRAGRGHGTPEVLWARSGVQQGWSAEALESYGLVLLFLEPVAG